MSKFTPGPWEYSVQKSKAGLIGSIQQPGETPFADLTGPDETIEANARLIAAAPEMLEALKSVLEDFELLCQQRGIDHALLASLDKPRAAIAKAEGQ